MSNINTLTKEQLFACLEYDGIELPVETINKAKRNDGEALRQIGYEYKSRKQDYSKAMAWYQLAVNQNNADAYNKIGFMYHNGFGVSQDHSTAMEYYLRAARGNHKFAMSNTALLFLHRQGVSVNKYKALEWFTKSGGETEQVNELNKQDIYLNEEDKDKTIHQLINETEDIIREERIKRESESKARESKLKQENDKLKKRVPNSNKEIQELNRVKSNEQELERLRNELQQQVALLEQEKQNNRFSAQLIGSLEHRLIYKAEITDSLKRENEVYQALVQSKNSEINLLKKDNQKYENIEKEVLELKRKLEEYERRSQPLIDNSNGNATANSITELDNQTSLNDTPNETVDNIRVKIEAESKSDSSPSCQIGNKKRKVASTDS